MMSIKEIERKLSNIEDFSVLCLLDGFVDRCYEMERLRGESAERRADIILCAVGAISAFLVLIAGVVWDVAGGSYPLAMIISLFLVLWLSRAIWYSLKTICAQSRWRIKVEAVFEFEGKTVSEVKRKVIAGKIWEHQLSVQPNSERHFYVQRSQRSMLVSIVLLLLLSLMIFLKGFFVIRLEGYGFFVSIVVNVYFWLTLDRFIEESGIWNHG